MVATHTATRGPGNQGNALRAHLQRIMYLYQAKQTRPVVLMQQQYLQDHLDVQLLIRLVAVEGTGAHQLQRVHGLPPPCVLLLLGVRWGAGRRGRCTSIPLLLLLPRGPMLAQEGACTHGCVDSERHAAQEHRSCRRLGTGRQDCGIARACLMCMRRMDAASISINT